MADRIQRCDWCDAETGRCDEDAIRSADEESVICGQCKTKEDQLVQPDPKLMTAEELAAVAEGYREFGANEYPVGKLLAHIAALENQRYEQSRAFCAVPMRGLDPEFFVYDDYERTIEFFATAQEASDAADKAIEEARDRLADGDLRDEPEIVYGRVYARCETSRSPAPEGADYDETWQLDFEPRLTAELEVVEMAKKIAALEADSCPPLVDVPTGAGDANVECSNCCTPMDRPHTWRQCAEGLWKHVSAKYDDECDARLKIMELEAENAQLRVERDRFTLDRSEVCKALGERAHPGMSPGENVAAVVDQNARLRAACASMFALISESRGVAGLHLNGDEASWDSLLCGQFSEWLEKLEEVRSIVEEPAR